MYDGECENNLTFIKIASELGIIDDLFWPNYTAAPWHLQMEIGDQLINFWPHKAKAHVAYESKVAFTFHDILETVRRVQRENSVSDDEFHPLVEDTE